MTAIGELLLESGMPEVEEQHKVHFKICDSSDDESDEDEQTLLKKFLTRSRQDSGVCIDGPSPAKQKDPKQIYEQFLESMSPEKIKKEGTNPEHGWGQKELPRQLESTGKKWMLVDPEFTANGQNVLVFSSDKGRPYSVTLCMVDISVNLNCYFRMQVLKEKDREWYYVFRTWGRIGTERGGTYTLCTIKKVEALQEFQRDFERLTANKWRQVEDFGNFEYKDGYMSMIDVEYEDYEKALIYEKMNNVPSGSQTNLPLLVKKTLLEFFSTENIKHIMSSYSFGSEKMPLGRITKDQMAKARKILQEAYELEEHRGPGSPDYHQKCYEKKLMKLSNRFYSTLPQSFGLGAPILLSQQEQVDKLNTVLDGLSDTLLVCGNFLEAFKSRDFEAGEDPLDEIYAKLKIKMEVVPQEDNDFQVISQYVSRGEAAKGCKKYKLLELIKIERFEETEKFNKELGNRMLLWHGSPIRNYPGIFTYGLRIAPSDAIQTGHAFGRGVYFSDTVAMSADYCRSEEKGVGYLLLSDVALGEVKELFHEMTSGLGPYTDMYQSIKAMGELSPDPSGDYQHPEGFVVPLGRTLRCKKPEENFHYNEYVVYNTNQVRMRYLCRVAFHEDPKHWMQLLGIHWLLYLIRVLFGLRYKKLPHLLLISFIVLFFFSF